MRKRIVLISTALIISFIPLTWAAVFEEIVARVNNDVITKSEIEKNRAMMRAEMERSLKGEELEKTFVKFDKDILKNMIEELLLVQKASDLNPPINVDADVLKYLDSMRKENNLPDMEALDHLMVQQGIDPADFKESIKRRALREQVLGREVYSRLTVTGDEISKYYEAHQQDFDRPEQVSISEIRISTQGKAGASLAAAEAKAQEALKKAKGGEKFDELAKKYSDGPTASEGGDLGFFGRGTMVKQLDDAAFSLRRGQVSDIIRLKDAFVIIRVDEKNAAGIQKLEIVSDEIHRILAQQKSQPAIQEYLVKLRKQAFIDVKPGYVDSGALPKEETTKASETKTSKKASKKD